MYMTSNQHEVKAQIKIYFDSELQTRQFAKLSPWLLAEA